MDDLSKEGGPTGSEARAFGRGPGGLEGASPHEGEGAGLAASANPAASRPGVDHGRRGRCRGHLSTGGAAGPVALPGRWSGRGAWRGREAQGAEATGRPEGGSHRGDGLCAAANRASGGSSLGPPWPRLREGADPAPSATWRPLRPPACLLGQAEPPRRRSRRARCGSGASSLDHPSRIHYVGRHVAISSREVARALRRRACLACRSTDRSP
jgi:hypothetical protein